MKRIIQISLFMLAIAAVSTLMGFILYEQANQQVIAAEITIGRESSEGFLNEEIIRQLIPDFDTLLSKKVKEIDGSKIESYLYQSPFIKKSDVFVSIDKKIMIHVSERNPLARIFNKNNESFYLDDEETIFPVSPYYSARVIIISGYIDIAYDKNRTSINDTIYNKTGLRNIYRLAQLITENDFLRAQISQIYVNSKGEYDLIPELGNHLIRFGDMNDAETKLNNLELFYKKALINEGWDKYETINLTYKDQVVCEKK